MPFSCCGAVHWGVAVLCVLWGAVGRRAGAALLSAGRRAGRGGVGRQARVPVKRVQCMRALGGTCAAGYAGGGGMLKPAFLMCVHAALLPMQSHVPKSHFDQTIQGLLTP